MTDKTAKITDIHQCSAQKGAVILCRIVELGEGPEAVCAMIADGHEIPRVAFPASVLRLKGLRVGSRFNWRASDSGRMQFFDIDTNVPQTPDWPPVDMNRLEALHAEMEQGLSEDGGKWPVYSGAGE